MSTYVTKRKARENRLSAHFTHSESNSSRRVEKKCPTRGAEEGWVQVVRSRNRRFVRTSTNARELLSHFCFLPTASNPRRSICASACRASDGQTSCWIDLNRDIAAALTA